MTVYVIQNPRRYDRATDTFVESFDFSPAAEFGEITFLLGATAAPWRPESILPELWEGLKNFSVDDHLLLVGNPILIGWATAIAADVSGGAVSLLQWNGRDRRYVSVEAQIFELVGEEGSVNTGPGRNGEPR